MKASIVVAVTFLSAAIAADERVETLRETRGPNHTRVVIRVNYVTGKATRTVVDERTGKIIKEQILGGRPQSSRRELERAISIARSDARLAGLFSGDVATEGGFIVDGPPGTRATDRIIQIRILSADRRQLRRVVLVNLSAGVVSWEGGSFE